MRKLKGANGVSVKKSKDHEDNDSIADIEASDEASYGDDERSPSAHGSDETNGIAMELEESNDSNVTSKSQEEYEVEQIVDMNINTRRKCPVNFRVRWVGYSEKEDTWLPATELNCDDLMKDFLEISGRNPEYERALEAKRKADDCTRELRQNVRKVAKFDYSERDEDDDEILPSGTKSRKVRTKAEKKLVPKSSSSKKKKSKNNSGVPSRDEIYEVEKILDDKVSKGVSQYLVRWRGFTSRHDSWVPQSDLNCPNLVKAYKIYLRSRDAPDEEDKEEDKEYEVEAIGGMREKNGRVEYKVKWKGFSSKHDSWLPEEDLSDTEMFIKFKTTLEKLEKQEDWQVESIVDSREKSGKKEYLIRWKGFESEYDTWEPEDHLADCEDILKKYIMSVENKKVESIVDSREKSGEKEYLIRWKGFESEYDTWEPEDHLADCEDILKKYIMSVGKKKEKKVKFGTKSRKEKSRRERVDENSSEGNRQRSKRKSAAASYSEFYDE